MSVLRIKNQYGYWEGIPSIKGDKCDKGDVVSPAEIGAVKNNGDTVTGTYRHKDSKIEGSGARIFAENGFKVAYQENINTNTSARHILAVNPYSSGIGKALQIGSVPEGGTSSWYDVYHTGNKPTPADVGAVSKAGDTVNGDLHVKGALTAERSEHNRKARTVAHNNTDKEVDFQNYGDDSNYVSLRLATEAKGIGGAVKVTQMKDGTFSSYTMLHTGNKEKIFTFGTEDLTAGTSSLGTGMLHFVYE